MRTRAGALEPRAGPLEARDPDVRWQDAVSRTGVCDREVLQPGSPLAGPGGVARQTEASRRDDGPMGAFARNRDRAPPRGKARTRPAVRGRSRPRDSAVL